MSRNFGDASRAPRIDAVPVAAHIGGTDRHIAAISKGDYAGAVADAHHDIELEVFGPREFGWTSHARGRAAIRAALKHNRRTVDTRQRRVNDVISEGNTVVLFGREQGRVRQTGEAYDVDFVHRLTFRDGRLASVRIVTARSSRSLRVVLPYGAAQSRRIA